MAVTSIADLFDAPIWIDGAREVLATYPSIFTSGGVVTNAALTAFASGPGTTMTMPFFKDISDQAEAIQAEGVAITEQKIETVEPQVIVSNREKGHSGYALAKAVSGKDPVMEMVNQLAINRLKRRNRKLFNFLRGVFGTALAANSEDNFVEASGSVTAAHLIDADMVIDANYLLQENVMTSAEVTMLAHPVIISALRKQDETAFAPISMQGGITLESYKGMPLISSGLLSRAGTTSGTVYDTYFIKSGEIMFGEKPQLGDVIDVASLQYDTAKELNKEMVYDRTRDVFHIDGIGWEADTMAGQSPTDAEYALADNWALKYQSANRVHITRIQSNG